MCSANYARQLQAGDSGVFNGEQQGWFAARSTSCAQTWPPTAAGCRGSTGRALSQADGDRKVSLTFRGDQLAA